MRYRIAVEDMEIGRYVCWALDLLGCFGSAHTKDDAVAIMTSQIADYFDWIRRHDPTSPAVEEPIEVEVIEEFAAFASDQDPEYLVNAFFENDRRSLSVSEVATGLRLLDWSRIDLLEVIEHLTRTQLQRPIKSERRGSIEGILEHVASAENWYLSQLGVAVDWSTLPSGVEGKLKAIRENTKDRLPRFIGYEQITESCNERWSARKILRRTVWHERAHTEQIARLITKKD